VFLQMQHFCFPDLGIEKLCSILVFGNVCFNIVRINHDNVASRGAVGRTHTMSDCRQEPVEKMERRISGVSYMYWMDFYNEIFCCGFLCARLISVSFSGSLFRLPRRGLPRPYRCIQANRLPRLQGYHTRATTLHINFWVQAGYHTCG